MKPMRKAWPVYSIEELQHTIPILVHKHNETAPKSEVITKVALFGSYAQGCAQEESDIDLLVTFTSSAVSLFALARVLTLMEEGLGTSVDIVQEPVPEDSLLFIEKEIPLYEAV